MKEKLQEEMKAAMRARDKVKLDTIRLLLTAIQYEEIQKKVEPLPADGVVSVLQREINKRREELDFAQKASRLDLQESLGQEIKIIEKFLPTQLDAQELEKIITGIKSQNPSANMGVVMKSLKESYSGQYDGKLASEVAKKVLG